MAFGFRRIAGRRYINIDATDTPYEIGDTISDRQYRKYVEKIGQKRGLPGASQIAETERLLEKLHADLSRRARALDAREGELDALERDLIAREQALQAVRRRRERHGAGQRRYNTILDAYVRHQNKIGNKINKVQARKSEVFKKIMRDVKGKKNARGNPKIAVDNRQRRLEAAFQFGGWLSFKEIYELLYGDGESDTSGFTPVRRVA